MATVARSRLREMLARATGFFFSSTTTGGGSSTTLVDTEIVRYDTPFLGNMWVLLTSGVASGESRRISTIVSTTITVTAAFSATVATSVTYEIIPFDPTIMHDSLQQGTRTLYPSNGRKGLWLPLQDETIVIDNLITNFDFETFASSVFTGWTHTAGTWTQETSRVIHGDQAATSTASGADSQITQNILTSVDIAQAVNNSLHIRGWGHTTGISAMRLRVTFDGGSTFTNGEYHVGQDEWEDPSRMYIDVTIPENATTMTIYCEVTDGSTGIFDMVVAWIDDVQLYTLPSTFYPFGPHNILMQNRADVIDKFVPMQQPIAGRLLRLEGIGRLNVPTTDSGTTEIDEVEAELLIAEAASHMFRSLENNPGEAGKEAEHRRRKDEWRADADRLRQDVGRWPMGAEERVRWGVTEEATRQLEIFRH